ncbi:MAG: GNAT family N-acetyltransferase [Thermomicrobiales bacterium]
MADADVQRMIALVHAFPARQLHAIDLPYRLCSPSVMVSENVRLWEGADGTLLAWAIWQQPWITLDYAVHQNASGEIEPAIIIWALERFRAMAREHGRTLDYFVDAGEDDTDRIALLKQHGFARADWHLLHLTRPLDRAVPAPSLPAGFTIRHLADRDDRKGYVDLHCTAFATTNMTLAWKERVTRMPQYGADLDLVAIAPDGRFAAFCVGWLHGNEGQVEPLGVHPDFAGRGLGRALLNAMLRRFQARGATTAHIEVYNDNPRARHLYQSVGFHVERHVWKYKREF